jgi:hypothetical protein
MDPAWIAVVGSLGGVAVGGGLNFVADELRVRRAAGEAGRERGREIENRRRNLCVDLATLADEISSRADSVVDYRVRVTDDWREEYLQNRLERLEVLFSDFNRTYNELRVLGIVARSEADELLGLIVRAIQGAFEAENPTAPDGEEISTAIGNYLAATHKQLPSPASESP